MKLTRGTLSRDNKSSCEREVTPVPGQSLPWGSSLSRVHVNRPLESMEFPDWVQRKKTHAITTLKDSQRLGRWDRLEFYISQRPLTTLKDHQRPCRFICVIWKQNKMPLATANDPERPSTTDSKFGAKRSHLNDNFERPLTTMKDCQRH